MYRQQVYLITNLLILLDAGIIILSGYAAYYFVWKVSGGVWWMDHVQFYALVLGLIFINNYIRARAGFYSDKRSPSLFVVIRRIVTVVVLNFLILTVITFFLDIQISRLFMVVLLYLVLVGLILEHIGLDILLSRFQKKGFNCRRILLIGSGSSS
jgi:FlaA1/EpsC-like NDP-sugar epimerase